MKARDKAKELVEKFSNECLLTVTGGKVAALIAIDEIMQEMDNVMLPNPFKQYWEQVKEEISKL